MNPAASSPSSPEPGSGGATPHSHALTPAEHAEYERLRRTASLRHRRLRRAGASLLLLLSLLLAPLAVVTSWLQETVTNTDRYVETVAPLASDPAVQNVLINRLTSRVMDNIDVKAVTNALSNNLKDAGAPPRVVAAADALAGPLHDAVKGAVDRVVTRVVTSDTFKKVWVGANRRAQPAVVNVLTGEHKGAVQAQGNTIQLNVGQVVDQVKQRLVDAGFEKAAHIPTPDRTITLFHTKELSKAQDAFRVLNVVGVWLPVVTVVFAGLALWTAPGHRAMLVVTATGFAVMMVVLLVALAVARQVYLGSVPSSELPPDAAASIYDTFVRFLRETTRTVLVASVITALSAYMFGPGRVASAIRRTADRGTTATGRALARTGARTGPVGRWLGRHRKGTTGVVIAAGVLALLLWNEPTIGAVALVIGIVLAVLLLLAILAAAAGPAAAGPGPGPAAGQENQATA
ncbi:hypothetical protein [Streptomyces bluensis]|uniref:hypothetical protein n=1 Tax=Streptomyces bluensis TaxID=33897 RepID=UPI00167B1E84|nr:hypothetical protein [Streptomyces bluensis]GGZ87988.1 hypothetical protein GCM10010344_64370 [Streptomyces bluensis]